MADNKWNEGQLRIIEDRGNNLLVSAAAGSGKTTVMVERIFRLISDSNLDFDIDRLLVVTFTNDAAAQMKEKIAGRIAAALEENPSDRKLLRQQMLLHNSMIMTIDSFCNSVVREFFHEIDMDPSFRIGQEAELKMLKEQTLSRLIEDYYTAADEEFLNMIESFCSSKDDRRIEDCIERLANAAAAHPWPMVWLEEQKEKVLGQKQYTGTEDAADEGWMKTLVDYVIEKACVLLKLMDRGIALCSGNGGSQRYLKAFTADRPYIEGLTKASTYEEMYDILSGFEFESVAGGKENGADPDLKEGAKLLRNTCKDAISAIKEKYFFESSRDFAESSKISAGPVLKLIEVTMEYIRRFGELKKEKNVLDFADLEHYALDIVAKREADGTVSERPAALELRERFAEIFVDEYQDSNYVQESILTAIAGPEGTKPCLFTVGDVKQSIYKFRMAKPELFTGRFGRYSKNGLLGQNVMLNCNYRSRPEILDSVNDVFFKSMRQQIGGIEYSEDEALRYGAAQRPQDVVKTELLLLDAVKAGNGDGDADAASENEMQENAAQSGTSSQSPNAAKCRELEATMIAEEIRSLVQNGTVSDKDGTRPVKYSDIVILLRNVKTGVKAFADVFAKYNIPLLTSVGTGFLDTFEIRTITSFLRVLDNPEQDIPLAAVLHSPIGGFSSDDLAVIRVSGGIKQPFFKSLKTYVSLAQESSLKKKAEDFLKLYDTLVSMNLTRDIDKVISNIYRLTGFKSYCTALPGGSRRAANLEKLISYATEYEESCFSGLFSFVRYIEQLEKSELDLDEAVTSDSENAVRLMTIHKSKGLEFPVVFVGGMTSKLENRDAKESLIINSDFGIGAPCVLLERRLRWKTLQHNAIALRMKLDQTGEELRLLYVAMTRAKNKLYLTGAVSDSKKKDLWAEHAQDKQYGYSYIADASCYMDFVMPAAIDNPEHFEIVYKSVNEAPQDGGEGKCAEETDVTIPESAGKSEDAATPQSAGKFEDAATPQSTGKSEDAATPQSAKMLALQRRRQLELLEYREPGEEVALLLNYRYPHEDAQKLPVKLSVSYIKKKSMIEELGYDPFEKPLFEEDTQDAAALPESGAERTGHKKLSGADRGTLYHKIMQFIPFDLKGNDVAAFVASLEKSDIISADEAKCIDCGKIALFFENDICARMNKADKNRLLRREQPFVLGVEAEKISDEYKGIKELIPVQGIIDCMFEEDGKLVILDYKTDSVKAENGEEELIKRYSAQLDYYADAASRIMKLPVSEKLIYSFALGKIIPVGRRE